jgi:DNA polymerase III subunit gamma/tau
VWDKKYRPIKFSDVLGQPGNVQLLKARLRNKTAFNTSYLFMGGHGQGKTTLARIHARAMLCQNLGGDQEPCNECENCKTILDDKPGPFAERDAASQGTVDHLRAIVETLGFAIDNAPMRIELFDEAHRMGTGAQDVLLKPLEEKKMVGMFCTTEPEKIKGTIRSRCEEYTIRKVTREEILERAKLVCQSEGVTYEDDALLAVIDCSGGHIRDILNKMEMISQVGPINMANTREYLHLGSVSVYYDILLALSDATKAIALIDQACEKGNPEDVAAGIAEAAMNSYRLANGMFADFAYVDRGLGKQVYDLYGPNVVQLASYFLQNRFATRVSLLRDVLLLNQLPGNLPPKGALPPVVFAQQVVASPSPVPAAAPPSPAPVAATPTQPAAPPPAVVNGATNGGHVPEVPLHELEQKVQGFGMPRMKSATPAKPVFGGKPSDTEEEYDRRRLPPDVWRREFAKKWPG